jgi:hypothetical protein
MIDELLEYLKPRVETLEFGGKTLTIRQLGNGAETLALKDGVDAIEKFVVRCTFAADGKPVFTDAHIPALKQAPTEKLAPLLMAVIRVNGLDGKAEEKNSDAAPSSG